MHDTIIIDNGGFGYDPGLAMMDGMVTGMVIGSLMCGPCIGGYYSPWGPGYPYYMRPYYCRPVWEPGWGWYGGGPPCPWWAYEGCGSYTYGGRRLPAEKWPVVIFDVARTRACRRLDVRTAVDQFRHNVPTRDVLIRCDCWQPSLRSGWAMSRPSTHESCAAAIVLFDAHDEESLRDAKRWCERATVLTEREVDETKLFMVMLVACLYGDEDEDDYDDRSQTGGRRGGQAARGEPTVVADAQAFCMRQGHLYLEAPVNTNQQVHRVMVTMVQNVLGKVMKRRREEQLREGALKQLADAMEPQGFFKKPMPTRFGVRSSRRATWACPGAAGGGEAPPRGDRTQRA